MGLVTRFGRNSNVFSSSRVISEDEMRKRAPSIFAEEAHESRSQRYTYVPTIDILRGLSQEGFQPFTVAQSRSRIEGKEDFTKHMVRLRHSDKIAEGGSPEIILLNSHDGTSSYQMMAGWYEFVCCNGLVIGETASDVRVPHKGDIKGQIIDAAYEVLGTMDTTIEKRKEMKALALNDGERKAFAKAALQLRYDDPEKTPAPIEPHQLLVPAFREQADRSVWSTFNTIQRNVIEGGLSGRTADNKRTTTRAVKGIGPNVALNRALSTLAEEMMKLKAAA